MCRLSVVLGPAANRDSMVYKCQGAKPAVQGSYPHIYFVISNKRRWHLAVIERPNGKKELKGDKNIKILVH